MNSSSAKPKSSSSAKTARAAQASLESLHADASKKLPKIKRMLRLNPQKQQIPTPLKRTRRSCPSSVVKIGRNFQKPFATARVALKATIARQFEDVSGKVVHLPAAELGLYLDDLENFGIRSNLALCMINPRVGHGLFVKPDATPIEEGEFIGIYAGEFQFVHAMDPVKNGYEFTVFSDLKLSASELDLIEGARTFGTNQFYLEVDGLKNGNFTRYLNHAGGDNANVEHRYIEMADGSIQIGFWARKRIRPGEQLLLDYKEDFWLKQKFKPIPMTPATHKLYPDGEVI